MTLYVLRKQDSDVAGDKEDKEDDEAYFDFSPHDDYAFLAVLFLPKFEIRAQAGTTRVFPAK
ncbi:MAG: hypothetical protein EPO24_02255 [Bacteroidetes bacterium]|nr:MAG: hypothetical protein EPO24_02255 [Bacteroidota bacterium]